MLNGITENRLIGMIKMAMGVGGLFILILSSYFNSDIELASPALAILTLIIISGYITWLWQTENLLLIYGLAIGDVILLSVLIISYAWLYPDMPVAMTDSPSFTFYFAILALHSLWRRPALILLLGVAVIICWMAILFYAQSLSADITLSYYWYLKAPAILVQAEAERLVGLFVTIMFLWLGVKTGNMRQYQ
ncbi:MAG: hypothetical protein ACWA5L_08355 [bacterium]